MDRRPVIARSPTTWQSANRSTKLSRWQTPGNKHLTQLGHDLPAYMPRLQLCQTCPNNPRSRPLRRIQRRYGGTPTPLSPSQKTGCRLNHVTWGRVDSTGRYPLDRGPWRRAPRKKRQKNKRRTRIRSRCLKRSDFRPNPSLAGWTQEMKCQAALFGSLVTNN